MPFAQSDNFWQKKKTREFCQSKGMLRTKKSLENWAGPNQIPEKPNPGHVKLFWGYERS
jgi:hypothetical protein